MRVSTSDTTWVARAFLLSVLVAGGVTAAAGVGISAVWLLPCPVRALVGFPCPGCGMTRACVALARGDVAAAWQLQPFSLLLVALALGTALAPRAVSRTWGRVPRSVRTALLGAAVAAALARWTHVLASGQAGGV